MPIRKHAALTSSFPTQHSILRQDAKAHDSQKFTKPARVQLRVSLAKASVTTWDGFTYPLTKQFFDLYLLLALRRKINDQTNGYVETEEILLLPEWVKNDLPSVGKQIRRHIRRMEHLQRNIIEATQKIKGPFRVTLIPTHIQLDEGQEAILAYLGLHLTSPKTEVDEQALYRFAEQMTGGELAFNKGVLFEALEAYQAAAQAAATSEQVIAAQTKIARVYERLGRHKDALAVLDDLLQRIRAAGQKDYFGRATTLMYLAWLHYRMRQFNEAELLSSQGLDDLRGKRHYFLMANFYNTLGKVKEAKGQSDEAQWFYQKALDYWALTDSLYGVQAAYYNLGHLWRLRADHDLLTMSQGGKTPQLSPALRRKYRIAEKFVDQTKRLCEKAGVGSETSKDHIELAGIRARLGDIEDALRLIQIAETMADKAGNKPDLEEAWRLFLKIRLYEGSKDVLMLL
ncbi:MAG: tetratricopeptide repeat protein [Candidatus Methylomirabilales bacterium]